MLTVLEVRKKLPESVINRIKSATNADSIAIFGSVARGEEKRTSDIDILVITRKLPPRRDVLKLEREIRKLHSMDVDVRVLSPKQILELASCKEPSLFRIFEEAVPVFGENRFYIMKRMVMRWKKG